MKPDFFVKDAVHFYEKRSMPAEAGNVDMQCIDVGIAGSENVTYIASWVRE